MAKPGTTRLEKHLRSVFPDRVISRVQVLEYGDDPAVEPGDVAVRVFLPRPDGLGSEEADEDIVGAFEKANRERLKKLHDELPRFIAWVEFQADRPDGAEEHRRHVLKIGRGGRASKPLDEAAEELTPVMTRLFGTAGIPGDQDTLITAGIAGSRAEVLRWAVGRIRENPAYAQLQSRVQRRSANLKPSSDRAGLTRRDHVTLTTGLAKEAAVEPATTDRVQQRIDAETAERFPL